MLRHGTAFMLVITPMATVVEMLQGLMLVGLAAFIGQICYGMVMDIMSTRYQHQVHLIQPSVTQTPT